MNIEMSGFSYHFSVEGTEGGLYSITLEMAPVKALQSDPEAAKTAMQDMMGVYTDVLDELLESDFLDREQKQPTMLDTSSSVNVGYRYKASWKKAPMIVQGPDISGRIADVFGIDDPDMRGNRDPYSSLSASIAFSTHKDGERLYNPRLAFEVKLGHTLNVAFFRFTQLLPELDKTDKVAGKIAMLDRTLALDWDRTGRDHFAELKRVGQQN